ncbi:hypothetical protein FRB90_004979 [Tulasnella sp. 427]|nr:hypothetical protein FRB90_004979 [Tulasnella sp. 427]
MVLGQCLEVMRNNQKRAARASSYGENIASRPDNKSTIVPFWYSKLTELFQDYFEGDGKAVMVVNVNPYDTGFDENSHVMKFAALAREVTTNVTQTKAPAGVVVAPPPLPKPSPKLPPARRTVSIVVEPKDGPSKETLWEVAEDSNTILPLIEDEDEPEERRDDLVDQLFDIIEELKTKLYESELRFAMAEVEIREEVTQEFEERIQEMEANFAKRRAADEEENDAKMDRKIDLLYKAGLLGQRGGPKDADFEDEEDIDASLAVDEEEDELEDDDELESSPSRSRRKEQPLPSERISDVSLGSVVTEGSTAASGSEHEESFELEDDEDGSNSDGTATDGEWAPKPKKAGKRIESGPESGYSDNDYAKKGSSKHPKQQSSKAGKGKAKESDVLKTSNNAKSSGGKKAPRVVPLSSYDLSVVQTPVVRHNARETNGSMDESGQDAQVVGDSEEEVLEPVVTKKKKRILGGKAPVTEDQILEVTQRVEQPSRGTKKTADVRRMVSS